VDEVMISTSQEKDTVHEDRWRWELTCDESGAGESGILFDIRGSERKKNTVYE
jgi:hypothetical protein